MENLRREQRIKELRRQDERKKKLSTLKTDLERIFEKEIKDQDIILIDDTNEFNIKLSDSNWGFDFLTVNIPKTKSDKISRLLSTIKSDLQTINYFSTSHFREYGLFLIDTSIVVTKFEDIIDLDGDMFMVYDKEIKNGLWIDLYEETFVVDDTVDRIPIYELRVFGKDWISKVVPEYIKE